MRISKRAVTLLMPLLLFFVWPALADDALTLEQQGSVSSQIRETLLAEQEAFHAQGCAGALPFFADREPLFVSDGRSMPSLAALRAHCAGRPARWVSPPRNLQQHAVHATSPSTGYSVSSYRVDTAEGTISQIVTKIWEKNEGSWRIVHVHESSGRSGAPRERR